MSWKEAVRSPLFYFILKVFIEFVTTLFLFNVLVFWPGGIGILVPGLGVELMSPALEGRFLTTLPPEKSLGFPLFLCLQTWALEPLPPS